MSTADAIKIQLEQHAIEERRKAVKNVIQIIRDAGWPPTRCSHNFPHHSCGISTEKYIGCVLRAEKKRELVMLTDLQMKIEDEVSPIIAQIESEIAAFDKLRLKHEETLFGLRRKIEDIREPVSRLEAIKQEASLSDRSIEVPEALVMTGQRRAEREQSLLKKQRQNRQPRSRPEGDDVTPAEIERWRAEESQRMSELAAAQRGLAVLRTFSEVVRERFFDAETGIWLPMEVSDVDACEQIAAERIDAANAPQNAAVDPDEPPETIGKLGAGARAQAE